MKRMAIMMVVAVLSLATYAGAFIATVKMADGTLVTFELPNLPKPDENGMFRFHNKQGGDIIVHAANVWIEEKSNKAKAKSKK